MASNGQGVSFLRILLAGIKQLYQGGNPVTPPGVTSPTALNFASGAQVVYNAATGMWDVTIAAQFAPGGDISGTTSSQEVIGILSKSLPALATGSLSYTGSAWAFITAYPLTAGGSCSVSFTSTLPSTLNTATSPLATRDWFVPANGVLYNFRGNNITNHWKISGTGVLRNNFDFITGTSNSTSGSLSHAITITTVAGDDGFESQLSSTSVQACGPIDSTGTNLGWGYAFRAPADTFSRTLTIYGGQYSCDVTLTATASDGSFVAATSTQTIGANTGQGNAWTVTYNTGRDGQYVTITVLCTANHGGSANVGFTAALLS